jgi:hypothetical protein
MGFFFLSSGFWNNLSVRFEDVGYVSKGLQLNYSNMYAFRAIDAIANNNLLHSLLAFE